MSRKLVPLTGASPKRVALPNAPLWKVIAQVRYPTILKIDNESCVADFQEIIRKTYPILDRNYVPQVMMSSTGIPNVQQRKLWRFADQLDDFNWRVALSTEFLSLETKAYTNRQEFLQRLQEIITGLEQIFKPTLVERFGMRYIDRIQGEALAKLDKIIKPNALGILKNSDDNTSRLGGAVVHMLTQAELVAEEGRLQVQWGLLPPKGTYDNNNIEPLDEPSWVLDFDMFTDESNIFSSKSLTEVAKSFSDRLYDVFRQMVESTFLEFYGGKL